MILGQIWRNAFLRDLLFSALSMATRGNGLRLKQKVQRRFSVVPGWSQAHLICHNVRSCYPIMSITAYFQYATWCHLNLRFWRTRAGSAMVATFCSAKSSSYSAHSHLFLFYWSLSLQVWMLHAEENRRMQITLRTFKPSRCRAFLACFHYSTYWALVTQGSPGKPIETSWNCMIFASEGDSLIEQPFWFLLVQLGV